jgi:hypothetical protein
MRRRAVVWVASEEVAGRARSASPERGARREGRRQLAVRDIERARPAFVRALVLGEAMSTMPAIRRTIPQ